MKKQICQYLFLLTLAASSCFAGPAQDFFHGLATEMQSATGSVAIITIVVVGMMMMMGARLSAFLAALGGIFLALNAPRIVSFVQGW